MVEKQPQGFFHELLVAALERLRISVYVDTEHYLVNLLADQVTDSVDVSEPLGVRLANASNATSPYTRFESLRNTADAALFLLGFWEDSLERRGVSRSYVVGIGSSAYHATAVLATTVRDNERVYRELSVGFNDMARVLDEVRENTAHRTSQDILKLFEQWKRTKSPSLAKRLCLEGVFPAKGNKD